MVFRQVGSDTDNLIAKFGLLNKSFANIKKDIANKQGWRSFNNIVSQQDIDNFAKFQEELKNTSYHKAFNNNLSKSHTYIQQQALAIRKLKAENYLLERQRRANKITEEKYNTAIEANNAQIQQITKNTQKLTLAQKASAAAGKAMSIGLNLLANVGISLGINLIISLVTNLVNAQENARKAAQEATEAFKEEANAIDDYIEVDFFFQYSLINLSSVGLDTPNFLASSALLICLNIYLL